MLAQRWRGRRAASSLAVAALFALGAGLVAALPAQAAPTDVVVEPVLGLWGDSLAVSGAGCTSDVTVRVVGWSGGSVVQLLEVPVPPAAGGGWTADIERPGVPAYVQATCDGVESMPRAIGATNGLIFGGWEPQATTPTHFLIRPTGSLLEDSLFQVYTANGSDLLGEDVVAGGTAEVAVPRSLGPRDVLALGIRVGPPLAPVVDRFSLGLPTQATLTATPRVAVAGSLVTYAGENCQGEVQLRVQGHSADWYDAPAVYPGASLTADPDGTWSVTRAMPPEVSEVLMACDLGAVNQFQTLVVGVRGAPARATQVTRAADGVIVHLDVPVGPSDASPYGIEAFTMAGVQVPLTPVIQDPLSFVVQGRPGPILLIGMYTFGENASAVVGATPEQYLAELEGPVVPLPDPPPGAGPDPGPDADPDPRVADRAAPSPQLAATGPTGATGPAAVAGVVLVLLGVALRRRPAVATVPHSRR